MSSPSKVVIRSATSDDINKIAEVLTHSFHDFNRFMCWLYPLMKMGIAEDLRDRIYKNDPHYHCFIAVNEDKKIIGTVELSLKTTYNYLTREKKYPYISNLAVTKNYRRQGVASKLLKECETLAKSWQFDSLSLHVLAENKTGQTVYLQNGYTVKEVQIDLYSLFLTNKRRLLLEKSLSN